jgi:hypothetical protein
MHGWDVIAVTVILDEAFQEEHHARGTLALILPLKEEEVSKEKTRWILLMKIDPTPIP